MLSEPLTRHEIEGLEIAGMCRLNEDTEVRLYFAIIVKSQQKEWPQVLIDIYKIDNYHIKIIIYKSFKSKDSRSWETWFSAEIPDTIPDQISFLNRGIE